MAAITDDELFHFLYEIGTKPEHVVAMALVHDVTVGRPFKEVWRLGIPQSRLTDARNGMRMFLATWRTQDKKLRDQIEKASGMLVDPVADSLPMDELLRMVRQQLGFTGENLSDPNLKVLPLSDQLLGLVFTLEMRYGRSHKRREVLEKMLWEQLLRTKEGDEFAETLKQELGDMYSRMVWPCSHSYKDAEDLLADALATPLLFISIPWVPPSPEGVPLQDADLVNYEKQEGEVAFHRDGVANEEPLDRARRHLQEFYPVSVYLPSVLARHETVCDQVRQLMRRMIYSLAWYGEHAVLYQKVQWWDVSIPEEVETKFIELEANLSRPQDSA